MSASTRPKRKAARKTPIIIDSSDSEEENLEPIVKKKRVRVNKKDPEYANENIEQTAKPFKKATATQKRKRPSEKTTEIPEATSTFEKVSGDEKDGCVQSRKVKSARKSVNGAVRRIWDIPELLAETENIGSHAAQNIVQLFDQENTIPFICRYRRDLINHITPERLRDIKNTYTEIVALRKKAEGIVAHLEKEEIISEEIRTDIMCAKTDEELEFLYAPYKPASKGSLAERAKALGLEEYADRLLYGEEPMVLLESIVQPQNADLDTMEKVLNNICHIISHNISKHTGILEEIRRLQKVNRITLESKKSPSCDKNEEEANLTQHHKGNKNVASKYELYFKFEMDVRYIKPHQVLAINRGEKSKFLTVKMCIPDYLKNDLKRFIFELFMSEGLRYPLRISTLDKAFEECYKKKLQPLISRQIRATLSEAAEKASVDVFAKNLKQLLLMSPLKGECILGLDPGFSNGCKWAVISESATVLETGVLYIHTRNADPIDCGRRLSKILLRNNCKLIALGNGTACRETEFWLTKMISENIIDARYSVVSEQGASIYSCSEIAKKEFPNMDPNEISAVSIARRLNDPLSEYVKIQPRHIGVGMYQHDVNEKILDQTLSEVVSECVSFVGVDINTASLSILKHVAGLTEKKAQKILEHRTENGLFHTRKDLLKVKSIGAKTFVQFAGFIRIEPRSLGTTPDNPLDCTWIHPESYDIAKKIIKQCQITLKDIGKPEFIMKVKKFVASCNLTELSQTYNLPKERLEIVLMALQREPLKDYRADFGKRPLFKQGVTRITDLSEGDIVTGAVTNITHFGAFVDIGVECDGLIHTSKMKDTILSVGDRVTASVMSIDEKRRRLGLRLETMLMDADTSFTSMNQ